MLHGKKGNNFDSELEQINKYIIEGLNRDDSQAMNRLYDSYYRPLCLFAVRYVSNVQVAEEVVSDVMYKIWKNRHNEYRVETFQEYLYTATRNTALNYWKQNQSRKDVSDKWAENLHDELIGETPLDKMITDETISKLNSLIDALPMHCRKVFIMSRIENMSYHEIAEKMGISINTVKHHIKNALQKLRNEIDKFFIFFYFLATLFSFIIVIIITTVNFS